MKKSYAYGIINPEQKLIILNDEPLPIFMLRCYLFVQQFMESQEPNTCL